MASFSDAAFSQSAFDPGAFDFGTPVAATTLPGGHYGPGKKRKKKLNEEYNANWNELVSQPFVPPASPVVPEPVSSEPLPPEPVPVLVSPEVARNLAAKVTKSVAVDRETRRKIEAMKLRMRQELDDEEVLLLLGAFD